MMFPGGISRALPMAFATGIAAGPGDIAQNSAVSEGWSGVLVSGLSLVVCRD
jgi:hypothetical protein